MNTPPPVFHFFIQIFRYTVYVMRIDKTIYLARHAKSSWSTSASDFERPLSKRGFADAKKVGEEMQHLGWIPECIMSSPALRASQTCQAYCDALSFPHSQVEWRKDFYAAYTITLLHALTSLDKNIRSVMLLGHNPSMEDVLTHLCTRRDLSKIKQANGKLFTTANVMQLRYQGQWCDLMMGEAVLDVVLQPKAL